MDRAARRTVAPGSTPTPGLLSAPDRRVVRLCLRDGLPAHEAGRRVGRSTEDVERLLARVVRALRDGLDDVAGPGGPTDAPG